MSQILTLLAKVREFTSTINDLVKTKPPHAVESVNTAALAGASKTSIKTSALTTVNAHIANKDNPHRVTLNSIGGVSKAYVDNALSETLSLSELPMSQFGDTTTEPLGIAVSRWMLRITKPIQTYIQGVSGMIPVMDIALTSIESSPADREFHVYLQLEEGTPALRVTTDKLAESIGLMYLGTVYTGPTAIVSQSIDRVTRLGTYRISQPARGSAIPTTGGSPFAPVRIDPNWTTDAGGSYSIATVPDTDPPLNAIAVSDEGGGRIVYDGAWAKLFNSKWDPAWQDVGDIQPGPFGTVAKYLYNAIRWVADPNRIPSTGGKVLVLGTSTKWSWSVDEFVRSDGLGRYITNWLTIAGYETVIKSDKDYSGVLDPSLEELNGYCAVIIVPAADVVTGLFTQQAVSNIVNYKNSGGGIVLFSEDVPGNNLASIEAARANSSIARGDKHVTPNQIATRFGVWFSGAWGDPTINIGYMRETHGDHPLYNGMADSENLNLGPTIARIYFDGEYTPTP